jgi:hypothetical protein
MDRTKEVEDETVDYQNAAKGPSYPAMAVTKGKKVMSAADIAPRNAETVDYHAGKRDPSSTPTVTVPTSGVDLVNNPVTAAPTVTVPTPGVDLVNNPVTAAPGGIDRIKDMLLKAHNFDKNWGHIGKGIGLTGLGATLGTGIGALAGSPGAGAFRGAATTGVGLGGGALGGMGMEALAKYLGGNANSAITPATVKLLGQVGGGVLGAGAGYVGSHLLSRKKKPKEDKEASYFFNLARR